MATSRSQAIQAINTIKDKGDNKAAAVRNTLTKVLEYTETTPKASGGSSKTDPFHIKATATAVRGSAGNALASSFTGIAGDKASLFNFSINLTIQKPNKNNAYGFKLRSDQDELLTALIRSMVKNKMSYNAVVPAQIVTVKGGTNATNASARNKVPQHMPLMVKINFTTTGGNHVMFDFFGFGPQKEVSFASGNINTAITLHVFNK